MKPDILSRKDIQLIITAFYEKLLGDEKMRPFFEDIVNQHQLEHHLEIITDFWNDILFDTSTYHENVMQKHLAKNTFVTFQQEHFTRWVSYFFSSIDTLFEGDTAIKMKARAQSIATVMQLKLNIYDTN
mgnify:CR=1 FL=1